MEKVLIIDDDQALRQLYVLELATNNFSVAEAGDGEEGLAKARSEKPTLILLDIMMPGMDGMAVLAKLKQDPETKDIPVVMLTNFGQEDLVKQAFDLGATDYLLKYKVTPAEMVEKVKQASKTS